jgi:hypothetical protein
MLGGERERERERKLLGSDESTFLLSREILVYFFRDLQIYFSPLRTGFSSSTSCNKGCPRSVEVVVVVVVVFLVFFFFFLSSLDVDFLSFVILSSSDYCDTVVQWLSRLYRIEKQQLPFFLLVKMEKSREVCCVVCLS